MSETTAYEEFQRGMRLLRQGHPHAAVGSLERARDLEPGKGSIREALGRAYFNTQRFEEAREEFAHAVAINPTNDYGHFGLGLALLRLGEEVRARAHLKLALAMNPDQHQYRRALAQAGEVERT